MLTRKRPDAIPATLTVTGQGETVKFNLTYNNKRVDEVEALIKDAERLEDVVLALVKEWETEYPLTREGVEEMEADRPGIIVAIMVGFHDARRVEKAKN